MVGHITGEQGHHKKAALIASTEDNPITSDRKEKSWSGEWYPTDYRFTDGEIWFA